MKILIVNLIVLFTFASCGKFIQEPNRKSDIVEAEFFQYVQQFYKVCDQTDYSNLCKNTFIPVSFGNPKEFKQGVGAYCDLIVREVRVKNEAWNELNENQKLNLIFHELAHCVMDKPHDNSELNSFPLSLMNTSILNVNEHHYYMQSVYVTQLFFGTERSHQIEKIKKLNGFQYTFETSVFGYRPEYKKVTNEEILIFKQLDLLTLEIYEYDLINQELNKTTYFADQKTIETYGFDKNEIILDKQNLRIFAPYYNEEEI